jgi:phage protein D/phage baseplate assembly protein gpV
MPQQTEFASNVFIKISSADAARAVMQQILEVVVDQHAHLPGMFVIRLLDPGQKLLDEGPFDLTKEVEIQAATAGGDKVILIKGEVTALEPVFGEGMTSELLVRGYDKSHRLFRKVKSKAHLNKKDSDLAEEIAQSAGLEAQVETTATVYDHIYQHNQSDLVFLRQRAWRIGYECFVEEGKLYFRRPSTGSASATLTWGDDLLSFRLRMTLAEQVKEVLVKGWDASKKEAIVGQASAGRLYPKIRESKDGASWAQPFGAGKLVIVDQPVVSQAEANVLAAARLDEISGAFIEAEGEAFRRPDVQASKIVKIEALGKRLSGMYLITRATHRFTPEGLKTTFSVRGVRSGLLGDELSRAAPLDRWPGVVPALVTNTDDPRAWGRVKVKFPWLADDAESDWARVVAAGAGPEAGLFITPAVGDEVVVAFVHGDFGQPMVLGGLWNGQDKLPAEGAQAPKSEKPLVREWRSRTGHRIAMYDNADKKVEIVTAKGHKVFLDDANSKIEIASAGGLSVVLDDSGNKITIKAGANVEVQAQSGNLKLSAGGNVDIQATGQVNIKGSMINLN